MSSIMFGDKPICVECRSHVSGADGQHWCGHNAAQRQTMDVVTGVVQTQPRSCEFVRNVPSWCGIDGRWFEAQDDAR